MTHLRDIRRELKQVQKHQYHPTIHLCLDKVWFSQTFTNNLYRNITEYVSLNELVSVLVKKSSDDLIVVVRREVMKYIKNMSDVEFEKLLSMYKFQSYQKVRTRDGLCKLVKTWNDYDFSMLPLVSRALNMDFLLFNEGSLELENATNLKELQDNILLVYKTKDQKYSLVYYKDLDQDLMLTFYCRKSLPRELDHILDKCNYFEGLIKMLFASSKKKYLRGLYDQLMQAIGVSDLTREHKGIINKLVVLNLD